MVHQVQEQYAQCLWAINDVKFELGFDKELAFSNLLLYRCLRYSQSITAYTSYFSKHLLLEKRENKKITY